MTRTHQPSETTASTTSTPTTPARVAFVGSGPGDPGLLTLRGRDLIAAADAIILDRVSERGRRAPATPAPTSRSSTPATASRARSSPRRSRAKLLVKAAKSVGPSGLVVRLMDGDPATFNGLVEEVRACRKAGLSFDVVPGVSAVTAGPTYAGVPLTSKATGALHVLSVDRGLDYTAYTSSTTPSCSSGRPRRSAPASPACWQLVGPRSRRSRSASAPRRCARRPSPRRSARSSESSPARTGSMRRWPSCRPMST